MTRLETIQRAILAALGHVKPDYRSAAALDNAAGVIAQFVDGELKVPRVAVHFDEHGNADYLSDGGEVDLLIIDERCPRDRVYLHGSHPAKDGDIDALIGSDNIGRLGDMPEVENAVRAHMDGQPLPPISPKGKPH